MSVRRVIVSSLIYMAASLVSAVSGMAASADATPDSASADVSSGLAEIVVTAQHREENVQIVPLAVSTVTATELERAIITDIRDVSVAIPSLTLTDTNGYVTASIRGVGSDSVGPGVENQVALFIDDVYYGSPAGSVLELNSIRQIDVLKGPQGTLFGRNATGGVVQISTRDPADQLSGDVNVSYGNYNNTFGTAYIGGPFSDVLKADIALEGHHQGNGWGTDIYDGRQIFNIDYEYAWRSKVLFTPVEGTRFTLIGDYSSTRNTLDFQLATPGRINGFTPAAGPLPDLGGWNADFNGPNLHQGWGGGVSLKWDQNLGPIQFVDIVAYRHSMYNFDFDYDGVAANLENIYARQLDRQFSEEFRLQSTSSGKLKWVLGAFYFDARAGWNNFLLQAYDLGLNATVRNFQTTDSTAGFGQATYEFLPDTNLTVGVRYTSDTKEAVDGSTTLGPVGPGGGPSIATIPAPDAELHAAKTTYRVSLDHRFTDQYMAYLSYNTGFKSGGFNTGAPGSAPYLPEKLDAAEVGMKSDFHDKRVRVNVAAYHYSYSDIQVQELTEGAITTINGASGRLYGVDSDISAAIANNVRISSGLGWNHARFTSFPNCPILPPQGGIPSHPGNCSGNPLPLAPDFVGNVAIDYTVPLAAGSLDLNANVYYNSGFDFTPDESNRQGGYAQTSASGTWTAPTGHFTLAAWGKNLADKRVLTFQNGNAGNGSFDNIYRAPRMYGVTAGYKF